MKFSSPILDTQGKRIACYYPTYFIADIAANHDSDLERAKDLIYLAAEAGADAVKFQHFQTETIVNDFGFKTQADSNHIKRTGKKSLFEVCKEDSVRVKNTIDSISPYFKE